MNKKCSGCGALLQHNNINEIGYVKDINNNICERCFRINHYNEYQTIIKDHNDYLSILENINQTNDLVILVVDLFNLPHDFNVITNKLNNNILLVLTKRDLLPKSVKDNKLLDYINQYNLNIVDKVIISSLKNYNLDLLMEKIKQYQKSDKVYIIGYTNVGKSTLINKIIYNYTELNNVITTSMLPSTTIDIIEIKINDNLTLIDTPGIIDEGSIINHIDNHILKKLLPKKEIKPITYQLKGNQILIIDNLLRIDGSNTNITLYLSNQLEVKRYYNHKNDFLDYKKILLDVPNNSDVVIKGLGFIKCPQKCKLTLYINEKIGVFIRNSLI